MPDVIRTYRIRKPKLFEVSQAVPQTVTMHALFPVISVHFGQFRIRLALLGLASLESLGTSRFSDRDSYFSPASFRPSFELDKSQRRK